MLNLSYQKALGEDPAKSPGKDFDWRGKQGPETGKGSYVKNLETPDQVSLHPDISHLPPIKPHWDYVGPEGKARLYTDGTWEWTIWNDSKDMI